MRTIIATLLLLAAPALAADPADKNATCLEIGTSIGNLIADGGVFVALLDVRGVGYDQMIVATGFGSLMVRLASGGCVVSPPMPIAPAQVETSG